MVTNAAPLPIAIPTCLPLPPIARNEGSTAPRQPLTSIRPLSEYSNDVLLRTISFHLHTITATQAAQLAIHQATIISLKHLQDLVREIADLEKELKNDTTGENVAGLVHRLQMSRDMLNTQRDRVIQLKADERRHAYNLAASRADVARMNHEIKSRPQV